jgi:plastocyanin
MLKRGTGRRFWLAAAVAAFAAMAYAAVALAASDPIVGGPDESFSQATYNTDQGAVVQFQDLGGSHNVTARQNGPDGKTLFRTPTITSGTAGVDGTQYLPAGDYPFFCTVHPTTMQGTLHVTGAGSALPRPSATLVGKKTSVAKAVKKGIKVTVNASTAVDGATLTAKLGKAAVGKLTTSLTSGSQTKTVKLNKAGKSKLRGKKKATLKVTVDVPFGAPATASVKLK